MIDISQQTLMINEGLYTGVDSVSGLAQSVAINNVLFADANTPQQVITLSSTDIILFIIVTALILILLYIILSLLIDKYYDDKEKQKKYQLNCIYAHTDDCPLYTGYRDVCPNTNSKKCACGEENFWI